MGIRFRPRINIGPRGVRVRPGIRIGPRGYYRRAGGTPMSVCAICAMCILLLFIIFIITTTIGMVSADPIIIMWPLVIIIVVVIAFVLVNATRRQQSNVYQPGPTNQPQGVYQPGPTNQGQGVYQGAPYQPGMSTAQGSENIINVCPYCGTLLDDSVKQAVLAGKAFCKNCGAQIR